MTKLQMCSQLGHTRARAHTHTHTRKHYLGQYSNYSFMLKGFAHFYSLEAELHVVTCLLHQDLFSHPNYFRDSKSYHKVVNSKGRCIKKPLKETPID